MTKLIAPAVPGWPDVTRFEVVERLLGGDSGPLNRAPLELLERSEYLKKKIDDAVSGALTFEYANRLKTVRRIAMTGDGNWEITFDGSGNVTAAMTLADTGVADGTYPVVTIDSKGRVTGGRALLAADIPGLDWSKITSGKPTTRAGYGIADAAATGGDATQTFSVANATQPHHALPLGQATGRLLNCQVFATPGTFTYTPSAGTTSVVVEVVGGGGGGGGCQANGASASSAGGGGGSGSYGKGRYTSAFSGVTVTVGAGGTAGGTTGTGGTGGSSSFGALLSVPGGSGAQLGTTTSTFPIMAPGGPRATAPSGANILAAYGSAGSYGLACSPTQVASGIGAASQLGGGAGNIHSGSIGNPGLSPGAGGSGAASQASGNGYTGGAGASGIVIVWEYA